MPQAMQINTKQMKHSDCRSGLEVFSSNRATEVAASSVEERMHLSSVVQPKAEV